MQRPRKSAVRDKQIVDLIQGDHDSMIQGMELLYMRNDLQRIAFRVYEKYGARLNDVSWQDLFCESIVRLVNSIQLGRFRGTSKLSSYFAKICSNCCSEFVRKRQGLSSVKYEEVIHPDKGFASEELKGILQVIMDQQDSRCRKIFELLFFASEPWQMEDIARETGLNGSRSAITTYYRCKKKLIAFIEKQPELAALIKSYL